MSASVALAKYNEAKRALSLAVNIDEVKDIRDKAVALRTYAMQARDRELIDHATEIRLRAERRAGELLAEMEKNKGARSQSHPKTGGSTKRPPVDPTPKLSDLGVNKTQSSRWQKLAAATDADFEQIIIAATQKACEVVDRAQQPKPKPKPKPKPEPKQKRKQPLTKGNGADMVAACISEVRAIVRDVIFKIDAEQRLVLLDELRKAVLAVVAEATARDTDADHWAETTH